MINFERFSEQNQYKIKASMNFKKIKSQIKKIEKLCKVIDASDDQISAIERDLLLTYIRNLYEDVLETKGKKETIEKSTSTASEFIQFEASKRDRPQKNANLAQHKLKEENVIIDTSQDKLPKNNQKGKPLAQHHEEITRVEALVAVSNSGKTSNPEIVELFDIKEATELSEKLSQLPIKNLKAAIGINEKIFTINELFEGDNNSFEEVVDHIDSLTTFDDAKNYLISGVATSNNWADTSRKKKAQNLIKLIKRRFS